MILNIKTKNGRMTLNLIEFLYPRVSQKKVNLLVKTLMADPWENETAIRETCMFFRGDMESLKDQQAGAKMCLTYDLKSVKKAKRKDRSKPVSEMLLMMFRSAAREIVQMKI